MSKASDQDRCQLFHKHGSRHTRCPRLGEMSFRVIDQEGQVNARKKGEPYDLRICYEELKLEPAELDAICLQTLKMHPPKEEDLTE